MKVIFMGTPDFSVGTLEALIEAGHDVVLAVTQPDKPKGRGKEMQFTPVKECALKHGIPVYQPKKVREPECIEELRKYEADIMVVIALTDFAKRNFGDDDIWMCQCACVVVAKISRGSADSVVHYRWGNGDRCHDHADGRRAGYRRYAVKDRDCNRRKGDRRKSS